MTDAHYGGNIINEITHEEHDHANYAKRTVLVSAPTIFAVVNTTVTSGANATIYSVSGATGSTVLLASNANRKALSVFNDSSAILYLKIGSGASINAFTTKLYTDDYYENPAGVRPLDVVTGVWDSVTGSAKITEFT